MRKPISIKLMVLLSLVIGVMALLSYKFIKKKTISMNQCAALITEGRESEKIIARFQRVITIIDKKGFYRDTGVFLEGEKKWRLNRFYTISLELISGYKYELRVLHQEKSDDDNVPDAALKILRPEQGREINITSIEEVFPDVWLFSGVAFPLFACKELKRN